MFEGSKPEADVKFPVREREARRVARPDDFRTATVRQWIDHWLTEHRRAVAPKTYEREAQLVAVIAKHLGDARLDKVTTL